MNEKIKEMWEWIKEHKKEVAIAGVVTIISVVGGINLYKKFGPTMVNDWQQPMLNISDTSIDGNLVRHHDGAIEVFIYEDIPLAAMGKLGEYLAKSIPDISAKSKVVYTELAIVE